jgi:hypothetical protein
MPHLNFVGKGCWSTRLLHYVGLIPHNFFPKVLYFFFGSCILHTGICLPENAAEFLAVCSEYFILIVLVYSWLTVCLRSSITWSKFPSSLPYNPCFSNSVSSSHLFLFLPKLITLSWNHWYANVFVQTTGVFLDSVVLIYSFPIHTFLL